MARDAHHDMILRELHEILDIDEDAANPICRDYKVPFKFTAKLDKVIINITEHKRTEEQLQHYREGRLKAALGQ